LFVSKNVCPPSILYWNGLTPEDTTIEIKPSSVSSELAFVMLTSAVISHPFSPKQNVSCVKLSTTTSLDSTYDIVTFIINTDNYPEETSWKLYDNITNARNNIIS
jgi:hypothetical protein